MTKENKDILMKLLQQHKALGISEQIDFDKFYLYSIITHSTAIEGRRQRAYLSPADEPAAMGV